MNSPRKNLPPPVIKEGKHQLNVIRFMPFAMAGTPLHALNSCVTVREMRLVNVNLFPSDVVKCVGTLVHHCKDGPAVSLGKSPAMGLATRLVHVCYLLEDDRWTIQLPHNWDEYLHFEGLSADGSEIIKHPWFDLAWKQLTANKRLNLAQLKRSIQTEQWAPPAAVITSLKQVKDKKGEIQPGMLAWNKQDEEEDSLEDRDESPYSRVLTSRIRRTIVEGRNRNAR